MADDEALKKVRKVEQVLDDFGKFFLSYREESTKKLNDVSEQILQLRSEIQKLKQAPRVESGEREEQKEEAAPAPRAESRPVERKVEKPQRIGDTKPTDVAIDKIFSNAHNKMMKR